MKDTFLSKKLKLGLFKSVFGGFLVVVGILLPLLALAVNIFSDDFEAYNLGSIAGQGYWQSGGGENFQVQDVFYHGGVQAISSTEWPGAVNKKYVGVGNGMAEGIISFWWYPTDVKGGSPSMFVALRAYSPANGMSDNFANIRVIKSDEIYKLQIQEMTVPFNWFDVAEVSLEEWHFLSLKFDFGTETYSIKLDNEARSNDYPTGSYAPWNEMNVLLIYSTQWKSYIDDISDEEGGPLELEIKGISPASGTEITDLDTNLTIEYIGFDWEIYDGFIVNFREDKLGEVALSLLYEQDELEESGNGQKTINLESFGISRNGKWYLTALGFGVRLDVEQGMFLGPRGYIDFWTDELVLDPYYLIFNVEDLPPPFTFTDPEDWYGTNVERFASSTALFSNFVGFLAPTFEKISDLALRTETMFDKQQAYDRGYALGSVFPIAENYIKKIDGFFGGFPLATFFKYLILVMVAIFVIRAVFKFIPFFG